MGKYILDSQNTLKNKTIEQILASKTIEDLLVPTEPNEVVLKSMISETFSNIGDNAAFYKATIEKVDVQSIIKTLDLNENESEQLNDIYETGDVKNFLSFYQNKLIDKSKKDTTNTYDLVGNYTKTLNAITKKHFANVDYMNSMVQLVNGMKSFDIEKTDVSGLLKREMMSFIQANDDTQNMDVLRSLRSAHIELDADLNKTSTKDPEIVKNEAIRKFIDKIKKDSNNYKDLEKYTEFFKEVVINNGFTLKSIDMNKDFQLNNSINNFKNILANKEDIKNYKIEDIKQFLSLLFLEQNDLLAYLSDTNNLKSIRENSVLKEVDLKSLMLTKEQINKIGVINNIANFSSSVYELSGTEINVNVSELFYNKFGVMVDDDVAKQYTKELFNKYVELKETTKNKNNNILLYITLHSFNPETKNYDNDMEKKYTKLLTKAANTYNKDDIELLDSIKDSWLKWAICHNREFKDNTITFTKVHPLSFNFSEFQFAKKDLGRDLSIKEIEMVQVASLIHNLDYKKALEFAPSTDTERKIVEDFVAHKEYNIKLDSIGKDVTQKELYSIMNIYNVLNQNKDLLDKTKEHGLDISSLLKSDKESIQNVLNNLSTYSQQEIKAIAIMLENTKVVPGNLAKKDLTDYIKFYASQMNNLSYKLYKKDNSLIPTLDYNVNKNYAIKSLTIKEFASILNGEVCNHCMSYQGASWKMIEHMFKKPESFLITQLEKDGTGIANSATWRVDNQICFDSIELVNNGQGMRDSILMSYREHSLRLITSTPGVDRITFGYSNHNNSFDFATLGVKAKESSTHPVITLPVNIYTDAGEDRQVIIFSTNPLDVLSNKLNDSMVQAIKEYSEYKDVDHKVIKDFLIKYNESINLVATQIDDKFLDKMSKKNILTELFDNYGVKSEVLENKGTSDKYEELKNKLEISVREI